MNAPIVKCRASVLVAMLLVPFATGGCATTLERARAANGRGDVDQARELYREAIDEPEHARAARTELAKTYVAEARKQEKRDPEKAEATYREALEVDSAHDQALTGIVRLLRASGRIDDAARVIATAAASGSCAA